MNHTFEWCDYLSGDITINATPDEYYECFYWATEPIYLYGECQNKDALAKTSRQKKVKVMD